LNFRREFHQSHDGAEFILQYGKLRLDFGMNKFGKMLIKDPSYNQNAATPPLPPYERKELLRKFIKRSLGWLQCEPHYQCLRNIFSNLLEQIKDFKKE